MSPNNCQYQYQYQCPANHYAMPSQPFVVRVFRSRYLTMFRVWVVLLAVIIVMDVVKDIGASVNDSRRPVRQQNQQDNYHTHSQNDVNKLFTTTTTTHHQHNISNDDVMFQSVDGNYSTNLSSLAPLILHKSSPRQHHAHHKSNDQQATKEKHKRHHHHHQLTTKLNNNNQQQHMIDSAIIIKSHPSLLTANISKDDYLEQKASPTTTIQDSNEEALFASYLRSFIRMSDNRGDPLHHHLHHRHQIDRLLQLNEEDSGNYPTGYNRDDDDGDNQRTISADRNYHMKYDNKHNNNLDADDDDDISSSTENDRRGNRLRRSRNRHHTNSNNNKLYNNDYDDDLRKLTSSLFMEEKSRQNIDQLMALYKHNDEGPTTILGDNNSDIQQQNKTTTGQLQQQHHHQITRMTDPIYTDRSDQDMGAAANTRRYFDDYNQGLPRNIVSDDPQFALMELTSTMDQSNGNWENSDTDSNSNDNNNNNNNQQVSSANNQQQSLVQLEPCFQANDTDNMKEAIKRLMISFVNMTDIMLINNANNNNNQQHQDDIFLNETFLSDYGYHINVSQVSYGVDSNNQTMYLQCIYVERDMNYKTLEFITTIIVPIVFTFIFIIGLLGNIIVAWVIIGERNRGSLNTTNILVLDLCAADILFIMTCIPFTAWDYCVRNWIFGLVWCQVNQYLIVVCALSSIYTLVLMSIDRFMAAVIPFGSMRYRTSWNTAMAILFKWLIILVLSYPVIERHGLTSEGGPKTCRFKKYSGYDPVLFQMIFFTTSYLLPLLIIIILYCKILFNIWCGTKPQGHKSSIKQLESRKKATSLVFSIIGVFMICWGPIQVMLVLIRTQAYDETVFFIGLQVFAHTLGYSNSCINPIVYALASDKFICDFKRSFWGQIAGCMSQDLSQQSHTTQHTIIPINNNNNNHRTLGHNQQRNSNSNSNNNNKMPNVVDSTNQQMRGRNESITPTTDNNTSLSSKSNNFITNDCYVVTDTTTTPATTKTTTSNNDNIGTNQQNIKKHDTVDINHVRQQQSNCQPVNMKKLAINAHIVINQLDHDDDDDDDDNDDDDDDSGDYQPNNMIEGGQHMSNYSGENNTHNCPNQNNQLEQRIVTTISRDECV